MRRLGDVVFHLKRGGFNRTVSKLFLLCFLGLNFDGLDALYDVIRG